MPEGNVCTTVTSVCVPGWILSRIARTNGFQTLWVSPVGAIHESPLPHFSSNVLIPVGAIHELPLPIFCHELPVPVNPCCADGMGNVIRRGTLVVPGEMKWTTHRGKTDPTSRSLRSAWHALPGGDTRVPHRSGNPGRRFMNRPCAPCFTWFAASPVGAIHESPRPHFSNNVLIPVGAIHELPLPSTPIDHELFRAMCCSPCVFSEPGRSNCSTRPVSSPRVSVIVPNAVRILPVEVPSRRVLHDVLPNAFQPLIVADYVFEIVPLPHGNTSARPQFVDHFRGNHILNRPMILGSNILRRDLTQSEFSWGDSGTLRIALGRGNS